MYIINNLTGSRSSTAALNIALANGEVCSPVAYEWMSGHIKQKHCEYFFWNLCVILQRWQQIKICNHFGWLENKCKLFKWPDFPFINQYSKVRHQNKLKFSLMNHLCNTNPSKCTFPGNSSKIVSVFYSNFLIFFFFCCTFSYFLRLLKLELG